MVPEAKDWLPGELRFLYRGSPTSLEIFDLLDPEHPQPVLTGVSHESYALGPLGAVVAYDTGQALHVLDLDVPSAAATDITLVGPGGFISQYAWSRSPTFIAAVVRSGNSYQQRLVHLADASASTPIDLGATSSSGVFFRWQP